MKTRFISFFLFMLTMSCFVACSSDDPAPDPEPEPEPEPVETVNTYTYKDKTVQAKSVSCFEQEGIVYVCMSPLQSLETMEDFMNSGKEYIMLGVDKKLVGTPVTVGNSDNDNYAFYYMDADGEAIVAVSPDGWEDVLTQGKITVTMVPVRLQRLILSVENFIFMVMVVRKASTLIIISFMKLNWIN